MGAKLSLRRYAFAALASSAGLQPLAARAAELKVIYDFDAGAGGANPAGNMVYVQGKLYGTTMDSGVYPDYGVLFRLDATTGMETALHVFAGGTDGQMPLSGVTAHAGVLYGTTNEGGAGSGTLFQYDIATGREKTLYTFKGTPDAGTSGGGLLYLNGALYGTSEYGGAYKLGTVFKVDVATGTGTVLHSFKAGNNGARPVASLTLGGGTLYGTTYYGGNHSCIGGSACGTVFKTDPVTGATSVLYRFASGADGAHPYAALTYQGGMIYGTTAEGGGTACYGRHGCGTAFQIDPKTGTETVLYRFTGGADGDFPASPLTYLNGTLYGTTFDGGHHGCRRDGGCGTFYGLSAATGAKTVLLPLHPSTGEGPFLGLTLHGDRIYGAAGNGGAGGAGVNGCDCGTVFAFKP